MSILDRIPAADLVRLTRNGDKAAEAIAIDGDTPNFRPVIRLFVNDQVQWLISEFHPRQGRFFGLCDLGQGFPELGYVAVSELDELEATPVEVDKGFTAQGTLMAYLEAARAQGRIILSI